MARQYWLLKADPEVFSFDDLLASPGRTTAWDGVRNYQARNYLRAMAPGDQAFFYHSNASPPGIVGLVEIARGAYPDPTQFERGHGHFDPRSKAEAPTWVMVDVRALEALPRTLALAELCGLEECSSLAVCQRGNRLSVSPVSGAQWRVIRACAKRKSPA
ncbi:MAG: EVE domain-containing protein [Planctomycetes bacterium]|jgi:predicted RNA-binding protein with PUA-like domain|nr:EVE domain-containing protein [Planctomycetota bacterium]